MKSSLVHIRLKECQQGKLNELKADLHLKDNSEAIRACIDMAYSMVEEKESYFINLYDIKKSLIYQKLKENNDKI